MKDLKISEVVKEAVERVKKSGKKDCYRNLRKALGEEIVNILGKDEFDFGGASDTNRKSYMYFYEKNQGRHSCDVFRIRVVDERLGKNVSILKEAYAHKTAVKGSDSLLENVASARKEWKRLKAEEEERINTFLREDLLFLQENGFESVKEFDEKLERFCKIYKNLSHWSQCQMKYHVSRSLFK